MSMAARGPGLFQAESQGGSTVDRHVVKSCQSAFIVAPPLQLGVVGSYLVGDVWFPSRCHRRELVVSRFMGRNQ
jgi:hypothetical protein